MDSDWDTNALRSMLEDLSDRYENVSAYLRTGASVYETMRRREQKLRDAIHDALVCLNVGGEEENLKALAILNEVVLYG